VSRELEIRTCVKCNIKMYPRGIECEVVGCILSNDVGTIVVLYTVIDILIL